MQFTACNSRYALCAHRANAHYFIRLSLRRRNLPVAARLRRR